MRNFKKIRPETGSLTKSQFRPDRNSGTALVVPTALYGSEAWVLENKVKNRVDVAEMSCLRSMCGVITRDRVKNKKIRRKCGFKEACRVKEGLAAVLKWFGHIERKEGERLVNKIYRADVECNRERGRLRRR